MTELARLGRTLTDLIDIVGGHVIASLAEFERDVINERAAEGRAAARARGRTGGRPRVDETKIEVAGKLVEAGMSSAQAARSVGVGRATLYRRGVGVVAGP